MILCPVGPGVAPKHETAKWWGYTSLWNLLNYPAMVMPVGVVGEGGEGEGKWVFGEGEEGKYEGRNERDKENWSLWERYGVEGYKDAPTSLQVVGSRFHEEELFDAIDIIVKEAGIAA